MIYLVNEPVIPTGCFGMFEHSKANFADLQAMLAGKVGKFNTCIYGETAGAIEKLTGVDVLGESTDLRLIRGELRPGDLQLCLWPEFALELNGMLKVTNWKFSWLRYVSTETWE